MPSAAKRRRIRHGIVACFFFLLGGPGGAASAQTTFVEVAAASGIGSYESARRGFGAGIAAADFDDDGDIDIFAPTDTDVPHQLYRNLGDGTFEEIASQVGLDLPELGRSALWLDYDADHRLDLLISTDCYQSESLCAGLSTFLHLFRQTESGLFVDVTTQAGLDDPGGGAPAYGPDQHRSGMAAGDINGDGYLDLVTGFWGARLRLHLNQGDGTFVDASTASGIEATLLAHHQPMLFDFDGDGRIDLHVSVDFTENLLFLNQGGPVGGVPSLAETAVAAGCANAMNDMGVALGDFDEDGDPDLYISNIFRTGQYNILQRNDSTVGSPSCSEISLGAGVRDGGWGWGVTFLDVDHDGDLDLAETNGWAIGGWENPPRLFIQEGGTFVDQAAAAGLTSTRWGSCLVAVDVDRDGDQDLVTTLPDPRSGDTPALLELYRNALDSVALGRHSLTVRPRMTGRNARAIGARLRVEIAGRTLTRWITAGTSYLGQEPAEAHFGLDGATLVDRLTIDWPGGGRTELLGVAADQLLTVTYDGILADDFESGDASGWSSLP